MWPFFWPALALSTPRRSDDATDADVRQSVQDVETDGEHVRQAIQGARQRAEAVADATGEGGPGELSGPEIGCIGSRHRAMFAPVADFRIVRFANAQFPVIDGGRWIQADNAVDIKEVQ